MRTVFIALCLTVLFPLLPTATNAASLTDFATSWGKGSVTEWQPAPPTPIEDLHTAPLQRSAEQPATGEAGQDTENTTAPQQRQQEQNTTVVDEHSQAERAANATDASHPAATGESPAETGALPPYELTRPGTRPGVGGIDPSNKNLWQFSRPGGQ